MRRQSGFTLIELVVVIAIVAILAAIAIPAYQEQVRKSRRAEAASAIGDLQMRQERWRADNQAYATAAQLGGLPTSAFYTFTLPAQSATDYTVLATPRGAQAGDRCGNLSADRTTRPRWTGASNCN